MRQMTTLLTLHTARQGLLEITERITRFSDGSGRPQSRTLALHLIGEMSDA